MKTSGFIKAVTCISLSVGGAAVMADDAAKTEQPTAPKTDAPATPADKTAEKPAAKSEDKSADGAKPDASAKPETPAKLEVGEGAQKVLDEVATAYGKLTSVELSGTMNADFEAAGQKQNQSDTFSSIYEAPNLFRHASKDEMVTGSTGSNVYLYHKPTNMFVQVPASKDKVAVKDLPSPMPRIIGMQNPSLTLAISKDPATQLVEHSTAVSRVDDTQIGDAKYPTLKFTHSDKTFVTVAFDPSTHLIRSTTLDLRAELEHEGVPLVKKAIYTVDYTTSIPDAPVKPEQFAWTPPEGAKNTKDMKPTAAADDANPADALVGKDAPAVSLTGLDGKTVALADLKGKVVVLDFWATWCGPCRQSLPHLDQFYQKVKASGVQIFAVNLQEGKDKVQAFVDKTKLGVPVLLDSDGKAAEAYKANAIPETVVVGKDGKVSKVFVGFDPEGTPEQLAKAVEEANKK